MGKLSDLNVGEKGVIVKVLGHGGFRKRVVEMGFIRGKIVEVLHKAPLKDPIEYLILDYHVSLRRSEAAQIEVISIEEAEHLAREHTATNTRRNSGCASCGKTDCPFAFKGEKTSDNEEDDELLRGAHEKSKEITVALVGNPNCGKTSLFNKASGRHEKVGNYSGVTVEAIRGTAYYKGYKFNLIDLPGTYSISAYSPEEKYVRKTIIEQKPDVILNVIDSSNLERNLFLTTQLIDMNLRMVIALNMFDELEERGDYLDYKALEKLLGIPMVPTVSTKSKGFSELFDTIIAVYEEADAVEEQRSEITSVIKHIHVNHGTLIERSINRIREAIYKNPDALDELTPRYVATRILQRDKLLEDYVQRFANCAEIIKIRDQEIKNIEAELHEAPENAVMDAKYGFIDGALKETLKRGTPKKGGTRSERIDNIVTHKWLGFPIFLFALFLLFQATFTLGEYPMDWIQAGVDKLGEVITNSLSDSWFKALLYDGIVRGVGSVIVFLPNILILFFFISLLEATGYMARAAFIMDKIMHKIGLHGRSFIPLIMGFGCNVPAVMATRTIENRNARMITILINPLMSCSARLPIYLLLAGAFFPHNAGFVIFCMYIGGVILAAIMAKIFRKFLFDKDETPFVMELPPYRIPTFKSLLKETWDKGKQYLHKVATIILAGSLIIWALSYFPAHGNLEASYLASIGRFIQPVLHPLGFNWQVCVSILSGIGAKEIVVSTLEMLNAVVTLTPAIAVSLMAFTLIYFPCIATIGAIKNETGSWKWALFTICYTLTLAWIVAFLLFNLFGMIFN